MIDFWENNLGVWDKYSVYFSVQQGVFEPIWFNFFHKQFYLHFTVYLMINQSI